MPKATTPTSASSKRRHNPLEQDLLATGILTSKKAKAPKRSEDKGEHHLDARSSRRVLQLGRELLEEDESEISARKSVDAPAVTAFDLAQEHGFDQDRDDALYDDEDDAWGDGELEQDEVDAKDLSIFNSFNRPLTNDPPLLWDKAATGGQQETQSFNLGDLILAKIAEKEGQLTGPKEEASMEGDYELPPKVVDVFSKIATILKRYRSGPLPKPFKVLPTIPHFEQILEVTLPDQWSPQAVFAVTRIFIAAKPAVATRFMEMVLLPQVRENIAETKKLNVHLFNAVKKSLYRPAAFFKGLLFPLVASGTATQREATIVGAALTRTSIPVLHSAAALKTLCDIAAEQGPRSSCFGATNILIKLLLDKKYALPYQTIDSLVFFFLRSRTVPSMDKPGEGGGTESLPVLWHSALLAFSTRYRNDITEDQREALLDLLLSGNAKIVPDIRKELLAGRGRGVPLPQETGAFDGDDTMLVDS